jgi:hypothetical protein
MPPAARRLLAAALLASAAASSSLAAVAQATLTVGAPDGYGRRADKENFASFGFIEQEFIVSGQAKKYKGQGAWGADGKWAATVVSENTPFATAMIVRRPANPAKFNGIVVVEWLNVSSGYPLDVDWGMAREAFLREGYAYVGVNVQKVGLQGVQKIKQYGSRYAIGSIPSDDISYDILSQVGKAVRDQASLVMGGLAPVKVFASGHSQSAMALHTYVNAIQPIEKVFDGFMVHGRANSGLKTNTADKLPSTAAIRADTEVPVFLLQSEADAALMSGSSKQIDTDRIRQWEVAGSAHADQYLLDNIGLVSEREAGWVPPRCLNLYNRMPFYMAEIAAFHHLKEWALHGTPPPLAPRLQRTALGNLQRDADGNAVGGLRLPDVDTPTAKYTPSNFTRGSLAFLDLFACVAGGSTHPFTASKLKTRYPTHLDYVVKYKAAADLALQKGYIRPVDHGNAIKRAEAASIPD